MQFTFGLPYLLVLLLLLPCFFWCKPYIKTYFFPRLDWIIKEYSFWSLESWFKVIIFSLMVIVISKPFIYKSSDNSHKKGRDLILAIDGSGSMGQSGFDGKDRFKNKFEINLDLSLDFIKNRFDDNMGVVLFGSYAYTSSPLTYDLKSLFYLFFLTQVGLAGENTAIGDAIIQSINTLSYGTSKSKIIILLTDGYHNSGKISPKEAVSRAKELGIKIYTIGIGNKSSYDNALLETISKQTNAKSYSASNTKELTKVYKDIENLEPSAIRSENYLNQKLLIEYPLFLIFILLIFWIIRSENDSTQS